MPSPTKSKQNKLKSENQKSFANSLRYKVLFANKNNPKMSLVSRMKHYHVQGVSIAVIDQGKIVWSDTYGIADEVTKSTLSNSTLFQSGSLSKTLTTLGILYLVQQNLISLDQDVNTYLKTWHIPVNDFTINEKVTLRKILSHSAGLTVSGFPGYEIGNELPTLIQILNGVKPQVNTDPVKVDQIPGTKWRYSGGGTTIAQLLIEDITRQPFNVWMMQNILIPLGMIHSTFSQPPENQFSLASGHDSNGKRIKGKYNLYPEMAAAGLWSTATDLANLIVYLQTEITNSDNKFISSNLIQLMFEKQIHIQGNFDNGLGIFLQDIGNDISFYHDGQDQGFIAKYCGLLKQKCGFVVMMNADTNGWYLMEEIMNSITDVYKWPGFSPIYRAISDSDKNLYPKFIGKYTVQTNQHEINITSNQTELFLQEHIEMPKIKLYPENDYRFFTREGNHIIEFDKNNFNTLVFTDHNGIATTLKSVSPNQ